MDDIVPWEVDKCTTTYYSLLSCTCLRVDEVEVYGLKNLETPGVESAFLMPPALVMLPCALQDRKEERKGNGKCFPLSRRCRCVAVCHLLIG